MFQIFLRFYEELNDFLPTKWKKTEFAHTISGSRGSCSVKTVIESLGVPHTEIDLILVNHESVDFSYCVQPHDRISVYPVFEAFDIQAVTHLRPKPLRETRFVLDAHLGKLAVYLRFAGFDTLYQSDYDDERLAQISSQEHRILLTRDRDLLKRRCLTHGYYVRTTSPRQQLTEIFHRFHLSVSLPISPRCTRCNTLPKPIDKEAIRDRVPSPVHHDFDTFWYCPTCDAIYWKGSHYQRMLKFLQSIETTTPKI